MFQFEHPEATITLQQGLDELNAQYAKGQNINQQVSEKGQIVLTAHDCTHVLFGCDISYKGEALIQAWTLWGTTNTMQQMKELVGDEHLKIARQYANFANLMGTISALPQIFKVYFHCRAMTRRYPFLEFEKYMNLPLNEIREQFGIKIVSTH
jgi:ubiquinone biosynthesis protein Coq4